MRQIERPVYGHRSNSPPIRADVRDAPWERLSGNGHMIPMEARVMRKSSETIFFLGAGASIDAGMPSVAELSKEIASRLPGLDQKGPAYQQLFNLIRSFD